MLASCTCAIIGYLETVVFAFVVFHELLDRSRVKSHLYSSTTITKFYTDQCRLKAWAHWAVDRHREPHANL